MKGKGWSRKVHWRIKQRGGDENVHCSWMKSSLLSVALNEMKLCIIMMLLLCSFIFSLFTPTYIVIVMWFRSFSILQSSVNAFNIMRMWIRDDDEMEITENFFFWLIQMRHMWWCYHVMTCDWISHIQLNFQICMSAFST